MSRSYPSKPADAARIEEIVALYVAGVASSAEQKEVEARLSHDAGVSELVTAARQAMETSAIALENYEVPALTFSSGKIKLRSKPLHAQPPSQAASPAAPQPPRAESQPPKPVWRIYPPDAGQTNHAVNCRAELVQTSGANLAGNRQPASAQAASVQAASSQQPQPLKRLADLCLKAAPAADVAGQHEIHRSETVQATLDLLLEYAHRSGLSNISYYPLVEQSADVDHMFLFASAGFSSNEAPQATGCCFSDTSPLQDSGDFWPFFLNAPTVFVVDEASPDAVQCYWQEERTPVLRVASAPPASLRSQPSLEPPQAWVEFPQIIRGKPVGKFRCGFTNQLQLQDKPPQVPADVSQQLISFFRLLNSVAPLVRWLFEHEIAEADASAAPQQTFAEATQLVSDAVSQCVSVAELNQVCTGLVAELLQAASGAMFSYEPVTSATTGATTGDDTGTTVSAACAAQAPLQHQAAATPRASSLLVMRCTSEEDIREQENLASFAVKHTGAGDPVSPLGWVARSRRSLCLNRASDACYRDAALRRYSPAIRWDAGFQLHEVFRKPPENVLLAAIPAETAGEAQGVLCYTQTDGGRGFSVAQQFWLERIVHKLLAPKYTSLFAGQQNANMQRMGAGINALSVRDSAAVADEHAMLQQLRELALKTMPALHGSRQAFYISLAEADGVSFRPHMVDDKLDAQLHETTLPLAGSLTQQAMQQPGVVYLNDLLTAAADGRYAANVPHARVAIACGIRFGLRVYGALVLESDRYDLSPQLHGGALQTLAGFAAESFAARDLASLCQQESSVLRLLREVENFAPGEAAEKCTIIAGIHQELATGGNTLLLQIVWRLLRCGWQKSPEITINVTSDTDWLRLQFNWLTPGGVSKQDTQLFDFYLATARQIASTMQSAAGRGSVTQSQNQFLLQLPLPSAT